VLGSIDTLKAQGGNLNGIILLPDLVRRGGLRASLVVK
jgi:hypothetical protein